MTNYEKYSLQVLDIYEMRYEDFMLYLSHIPINDSLFQQWLIHALENILYVLTRLVEDTEISKLLASRYHLLLDEARGITPRQD
jgi:hypothetical protein